MKFWRRCLLVVVLIALVVSAVTREPLAAFLYHLWTSGSPSSFLYFSFWIPIDNQLIVPKYRGFEPKSVVGPKGFEPLTTRSLRFYL